MAKLTVQDVFRMFEPFGIRSERVTAVLNSCKDQAEASKAFDALKSVATNRYDEMRNGSVSPARFRQIKPIYERLMKISLKNYRPPKPKHSPADEKARMAARIYGMMKRNDISGISSLLGEDPVDAETEQSIINEILNRFSLTKKR